MAQNKKRLKASNSEVRIARVVGENEEGLTLFVPKNMDGEFHLEGGEKFLSMIFVHNAGNGELKAWLPWEGRKE
jgi:hypothetical protein